MADDDEDDERAVDADTGAGLVLESDADTGADTGMDAGVDAGIADMSRVGRDR